MSNRGRGHGGRGQALRDQPPQPSSGHSAASSAPNPLPHQQQPHLPTQFPPLARAPTSPPPSINLDLQRKMTISPAPAPAPAPPKPIAVQAARRRAPTSSKAVKPAAKPGYGTLGRKCVVKANHFLVQIADRSIHHYDAPRPRS